MVKVSLVIPVYNSERFLERCLESLVHQTLSDVQIIVINDGSLDGSEHIISEYISKYPGKVEGYFLPNSGVSAARNLGIEHAKGEYIGFVDSDDYCDETMYEKLYIKAIKEDADIVVCNYFEVDDKAGTMVERLKGNSHHFGAGILDNPRTMRLSARFCWNKLFKRVLFDASGIRFPEKKIYEDIPFVYSMFSYANRICKVDEPLYFYGIRGSSRISEIEDKTVLDLFDTLEMLNRFYQSNQSFNIFYNELLYINLNQIFGQFDRFTEYENSALKREIMSRGYDLLNAFFPDWRDFHMFFYNSYGHDEFKIWREKSYVMRFLMAILPKGIFSGFKGFRRCLSELYSRDKIRRNYYAACLRDEEVQENLVLFENFKGKEVGDSPYAIAKELNARGGYEIWYATDRALRFKHRMMLNRSNLKDIHLVSVGSFKYNKLLATAKYLVNNECFPQYFIRRDDQVYLNTWMGTPFKTVGKRRPGDLKRMINEERNFLQASYILCSNRFSYERLLQDYNLGTLYTGKILMTGQPRNAIFFDEVSRETIRERYEIDELEVFAYMPTARTEQEAENKKKYEDEVLNILKGFDETLNDRQCMYVKFHLSNSRISLNNYKHLRPFPEDMDSHSFLNAVDILVTDYSGVMFDFATSKRPVALFMYDYDEFVATRGMYIDVRELPFKKFIKLSDMKSFFRAGAFAASDPGNRTELEVFYTVFTPYESGNVTQKLVDRVFEGKLSYIEEKDFSGNANSSRLMYLSGALAFTGKFNSLNDLRPTDRPVVIFNDRHINKVTREFLNARTNNWDIPWTIVDPFMCLTRKEVWQIYMGKSGRKKVPEKVFDRELRRVLPGITFHDTRSDDEGWYMKGLTAAAERTKKK